MKRKEKQGIRKHARRKVLKANNKTDERNSIRSGKHAKENQEYIARSQVKLVDRVRARKGKGKA